MTKRWPRGLYAVTPDEADTSQLIAKVRLALAGGAVAVQYRNKSAGPTLRRAQAAALAEICREAGAPLIVNDDVTLALEVGAAGVHLGREDGELAAARSRLGPAKLLGASCYNRIDLAVAAAGGGADYVAFGAMFASPTKPAARGAPLALLGDARRRTGLPVVAIGGITLDNAAGVVAAGADALAVISALFAAEDIAARARAFQELFERSVTP